MNFLPDIVKEAFQKAMKKYQYDNRGSRWTPSSLTNSGLYNKLKEDHPEIQPSVEAMTESIQGTVLHSLLEDLCFADDELESELRIFLDMDQLGLGDGYMSAQIDLISLHPEDSFILDHKRRSVWEVLIDRRTDIDGVAWATYWQLQIGMYLWNHPKARYAEEAEDEFLLSEAYPNRPKITKAYACYWFKDWVKSKAMIGEHPASPCMTKKVEYIGNEKVEEFIKTRVQAQTYLGTCEDVNTWYRPGKFKVKKVGNKNATKNFDDPNEALRYGNDLTAKTGNKYFVEEESGTYPNCESYCLYRFVCPVIPTNPKEDPWKVLSDRN